MRRVRSCTVVFVSSIGARISNPLLGMYHASKYALSAMAEALAVECRAFGIRVVTIEPGMVDTELALQDHFSTGGTLGLGLPGVGRMMDEFAIESRPGAGTPVTVRKWR